MDSEREVTLWNGRCRWTVLLAACLWAASSFAEVSAAGQKIDFFAALQLALDHSPDYATASLTAKNARLATKSAWAAMLPEVDLALTNMYSNEGGSSQPTTLYYSHAPWFNYAGLNITENLYDNGVTLRNAQVAGLNEQISELSLTHGKQDLLLKVAKSFYDFSSAAQAGELQKEEIETLRQQFRTIEGRYRQGVSSNRDFLRIKVQLQRAEIGLATQAVTLEDAKSTLRLAIGVKNEIDFLPYVLDSQRVSSLSFPDVEAEETLDYRIAHVQEEVSGLKYQAAVRNYWPNVAVSGSYSYDVPEYIGPFSPGLDDPYWNLQGMLVLSYALFDWGIRGRAVEIAANQKQIEINGQDTIRMNASQSLARLRAQSRLLLASFKESQTVLKDEQAAYDSMNLGYREGKVSYIDLITELDQLYSSRSQNLDLRYRLLKARADLGYYKGDLDETLKN